MSCTESVTIQQLPAAVSWETFEGDDKAFSFIAKQDGAALDLRGWLFTGEVHDGHEETLTIDLPDIQAINGIVTVRASRDAPVCVARFWVKSLSPTGVVRTWISGTFRVRSR